MSAAILKCSEPLRAFWMHWCLNIDKCPVKNCKFGTMQNRWLNEMDSKTGVHTVWVLHKKYWLHVHVKRIERPQRLVLKKTFHSIQRG